MIIHVDDLVIFARTQENLDGIKQSLKTEFCIKEPGELKYCLGIEMHRTRPNKTICMNQRSYIRHLTEKFGVDSCKDVHNPSNESGKLSKLEPSEEFIGKWPYRELVGALMYIATCTRPEIMHAVGEAAKHCERHGRVHWNAANVSSSI